VGARPSLVSFLAGVLNIFFALGCVPLYFTIERVGRRSVLLYVACVMSVLILIFTVLQAVPATTSIQWAGIGIIFLFHLYSGTRGKAVSGSIVRRLLRSNNDTLAVLLPGSASG
jgi:hypothetical protein